MLFILYSAAALVAPQMASSQAFGEYGRTLGSLPRGPAAVPRSSGPGGPATIDQGGIGELGGRALPARLIVITSEAGLFSRQDSEVEKIAGLVRGEKLIPLIQSEGSISWYMVKTEKGAIGWVKASDVKQETPVQKR